MYYFFIVFIGIILFFIVNNVSNGIEFSFVYYYVCNVIWEGCKFKEKVDVFFYELLVYCELVNSEVMFYSDDEDMKLFEYFMAMDNVLLEQYVDIQVVV